MTGAVRFASLAALRLTYKASTSCLSLLLVEGKSVTDCTIHTMATEPEVSVTLSESVPVRLVLGAEMLASGLAELDWGSEGAQKDRRVALRVTMSPLELTLTVSSEEMGCEMVYPPEAVTVFNATEEVEFDYRFALLHMAVRSLQQADEACLQIDSEGLLEVQLKFANAQFVRFTIHPLLDDEDGGLFGSQMADD